ncbi:Leucine-rich repeat-containing protein 48 [Microtus ochrogaster]|uniref:Dynein regulatory complex subunit 3 n=1 Tax=Microtus ochrogaster TaxID=79684 RepID=A0A8J6G7N9_MICOH|nr:Leucine-rich repeat-containing protein 48 [Microtus ochrogaster]
MSRPYDSMDPKVMDDDMLKAAVGEQGPQEEAGQLAKQEGILFKDVLSLQLDFQNILRIDNLWQFENLQKLQLNNNIIERIEGLENLTHLVWLDLSFNNIEAIEGLDTLVNLEDLSLSNNRISKMDSLDALVKLQVLSLGNNQISNIMNVIYLRRFPCLRTLSLSGNPIAEAEEYKMFIYAYLPDLVYLDFRHIDEQVATFMKDAFQHTGHAHEARGCVAGGTRNPLVTVPFLFLGQKEMAKIKHQYSIDELKHREAQMQARLEAEKAQQEKLAEHKMAFIDHLDGSFLFDSMYSEDVEGNKLSYLPGVGELLETYPFCVTAASLGAGLVQPLTYKDKFVIICLNIFEYGLKQQEKRKAELDTFNECIQEAIQENQNQGKLKVAKFEEKHLLNVNAIREESELPNIEKKLIECSDDITELFNMLMTLEMQLVEQLEVEPDWRRHRGLSMQLQSLTSMLSQALPLMAQCRDLENHHHEKLLEITINTLEKILKGEMDEDLPDDVRALFVDKDTIVNAVGASHDIHLLKIDNREDELVTGINSWCAQLLDKIHKDEIMRNRKRVKEINQYIDHMQSELDNLECGDIID